MGGRGASSSGAGGRTRLNLADPRIQQDYPTEEQNALYQYTKSSSINKYLGVYGEDAMSDAQKEQVKNMDAAIAKSGWNEDQINTPYLRGGGAMMVGVPYDVAQSMAKNPEALANYINTNLLGVPTTNKAYTSMTTSYDTAKDFADYSSLDGPIIMEYKKIGKGMRGAYVSGGTDKKAISFFGKGEDETIGQRNIVTTPLQAYVGKDGFVHVWVEAHGKG